jgi:predicted HTH transcriptional regulator
MNADQKRIEELLAHPSESLNVEIKNWINPDDKAAQAKIVRAALALRNRNGGYLIIGFDDKTGLPDPKNRPSDIHRHFIPTRFKV